MQYYDNPVFITVLCLCRTDCISGMPHFIVRQQRLMPPAVDKNLFGCATVYTSVLFENLQKGEAIPDLDHSVKTSVQKNSLLLLF